MSELNLVKKGEKNSQNLVPIKTLISFGMGSLGNNIICAMIGTYLTIYLTDSFGISAAAVGTLFLVARIIDAITDPIMGIIVDNTNTKLGKSRPYLFVVPIFMGVATIMCFSSPDLSYSNKIIWMYVSYILWGISFTAMDIPYWSLSANITRSSQGKTKIVTAARTVAYVGNFIVLSLTIPLVSILGSWTKVAIIYVCFATVFTWITAFRVKELTNNSHKKEKQGVKQFINLLKSNKPLRIVLLSMLVLELSGSIKSTILIYYVKYNFNSEMMIPIVSSIGMAASMGAFLLAAGAKGKRLALPNSDIMIHQPSGGAQGQATDMEIHTRHILDMKKRLNQILADNTGQPIDVIAKDTNRDNFMTAQQALEYGLIDKVIEKR